MQNPQQAINTFLYQLLNKQVPVAALYMNHRYFVTLHKVKVVV